jgi:hypothetical protein
MLSLQHSTLNYNNYDSLQYSTPNYNNYDLHKQNKDRLSITGIIYLIHISYSLNILYTN